VGASQGLAASACFDELVVGPLLLHSCDHSGVPLPRRRVLAPRVEEVLRRYEPGLSQIFRHICHHLQPQQHGGDSGGGEILEEEAFGTLNFNSLLLFNQRIGMKRQRRGGNVGCPRICLFLSVFG
jgi:hypothetical protein